MKVGDTVWLRDINRRQYDKRGRMVERFTFFPQTIVAENRASWLTDDGYRIDRTTRIVRPRQRGGYYGLSPNVWESEAAVEGWCWARGVRHRVADAVKECEAPDRLRAVMKALGLTDADVVDN